MRHRGLGLGRAVGAAVILGMALSAIGARAADEVSGPPCSATVKDHCIEGAAGSGGTAKRHKHAAHHAKHKAATAKPAPAAKPTPAKPAAPAAAKPKAK